MVSIETALKQLAEDVKAVINERISKYGYNTRAKKNTLEGSDLQKTMEVKPTEDGIVLQIADYWEFISRVCHCQEDMVLWHSLQTIPGIR